MKEYTLPSQSSIQAGQHLAEQILRHVVIPAQGRNLPVTFSQQLQEDLKFNNAPHAKTQTVLDALQKTAEGTANRFQQLALEKHLTPVLQAYQRKFQALQRDAAQMADGLSPISGFSLTKSQQEEASQMNNCFEAAGRHLIQIEKIAARLQRFKDKSRAG